MAVLDNADFQQIKKIIFSNPDARTEFKAWGLSKQVWMNTFQAAEDWFLAGFNSIPSSSFKAALETEAGTMTNAQAKHVGKSWFQWRIGQIW